MGIIADHIYLKALHENDFSYFRLAKYLFPFEKELVVADGLMLLKNKIYNQGTYLILKDDLRYDPYSIEILGMYIQFTNAFGKPNETIAAYKLLKKIGPNTNILKQINQLNIPILKGL